MQSFHIALSWSTSGAGGSGRVVETLTDYLPRLGVEVKGAVLAPADVAERTGGRLQLLAPPGTGGLKRLVASREMLVDALRTVKPDILASHFALFTLPAMDRLKAQPFVVHFHGPWAEEARVQGSGKLAVAAMLQVERAVYRRGNRVITLSKAFADVLVRDYSIKADRIRIIPGSVDLERFILPPSKQAARSALGWPEGRKILVSVRRLVPRMGLGNLIQAISLIRKQHPEVLLYMVGKGPLQKQLQEQIVSLGLEEHVVLLGFVPDDLLVNAYQAADMNIVPTLALEGFGLIAAESLAAGTPALVTPVGGLPEVVGGFSSDLVFESTSADDIAAGLRRFLSGEVAMPSPQACRSYAEKHFAAPLMAERTVAVYNELV